MTRGGEETRRSLVAALVAIPVKPFGVAKRRLAPVLSANARRHLGRTIAARTVESAAGVATHVAVVTGDLGVARWAEGLGAAALLEPRESGLNGAAGVAVAEARRRNLPWLIVHADLPLLRTSDLFTALQHLEAGAAVLAPSHDGGTTLLGADLDHFPFGYGPGSFRRHLATVAPRPHRILIRTGLALDLDNPADLATARGLSGGAWIEREIRQARGRTT